MRKSTSFNRSPHSARREQIDREIGRRPRAEVASDEGPRQGIGVRVVGCQRNAGSARERAAELHVDFRNDVRAKRRDARRDARRVQAVTDSSG